MLEIDRYVAYIKNKAYSSYIVGKCGYCAKACREAIEHGLNKVLERKDHAKEYGTSLIKVGFKSYFKGTNLKGIQFKVGDVAILNYEPSGHMCIYDGTTWYSDFKQLDVYGGKIRLKLPEISLYRLGQ